MADEQELQREQAKREQESRESDVTKFEEIEEEVRDEQEDVAHRVGEPLEPEDR